VSADVVCIIEAPNHMTNGSKKTVDCLENFAAHFSLQTTSAMIGFSSPGKQEIAVLFNPDTVGVTHVPGGGGVRNPPFNRP